MSPDAARVGGSSNGRLVVVVGPSGVGKDSLLAYAQAALGHDPRYQFVRRVVTRLPNGAEDHDTMNERTFAEANRAGAFAVVWQAHGLHYGVPVEVHDHINGGGVAVLNGSRAALGSIRSVFTVVEVVSVTAQREIIRQRLLARGRESLAQVEERLARMAAIPDSDGSRTIDNSGDIGLAGDTLIGLICAPVCQGWE